MPILPGFPEETNHCTEVTPGTLTSNEQFHLRCPRWSIIDSWPNFNSQLSEFLRLFMKIWEVHGKAFCCALNHHGCWLDMFPCVVFCIGHLDPRTSFFLNEQTTIILLVLFIFLSIKIASYSIGQVGLELKSSCPILQRAGIMVIY